MKLNKNGWGYKEMFLMSSILLIFLLIAAYNIYALYNELGASDAVIYVELENKMQLASVRYINDNNLKNDRVTVSLSQLKEEGYISAFKDSDGYDCNGYLIYENYNYNAYIKCPNYISKNYSSFNE